MPNLLRSVGSTAPSTAASVQAGSTSAANGTGTVTLGGQSLPPSDLQIAGSASWSADTMPLMSGDPPG